MHAKLSPSSSAQWTMCAVAPRRQEGYADNGNDAADNGTVGHDLAEKVLKGTEIEMYRGKFATVDDNHDVTYFPTVAMCRDRTVHVIDDEMIESVTVYTDFVRELAKGGDLHVECRLPIDHITGEAGARGTSDTVILFPEEICVVDLKLGYVQVDASDGNGKPNTQLAMYADGALREFEMFGDFLGEFKRVRIIIVQPRCGHIDEFVMTIEEHRKWIDWIRERAQATWEVDAVATPGEKQCKYCKDQDCAERRAAVLSEVFNDFDEPREVKAPELGALWAKLPFIRSFCKMVEERVYTELDSGKPVAGCKMVDGDKGNRQWCDETQATALLSTFNVEMYKKTLISPTVAEKLLKKKSPGQWADCEALITRPDGKPTVVLESDPRPARANHADDFDDDNLSDFF